MDVHESRQEPILPLRASKGRGNTYGKRHGSRALLGEELAFIAWKVQWSRAIASLGSSSNVMIFDIDLCEDHD